MRSGCLQFGQDERLEADGLAVMSSRESDLLVTEIENSQLLVLIGEPINEPISASGPFVMNSYNQVPQGFADLKGGFFGRRPA